MRGGRRKGAGRPKGTTKGLKVNYHRRVRPHWVNILDNVLSTLKKSEGKDDKIVHE